MAIRASAAALGGGDGLDVCVWGAYFVSVDEGLGDGLGEFVELGGAHDGPRHTGVFGGGLLSELAAHVAGDSCKFVGAHDGQHHVVADAGIAGGVCEVRGGLLEERLGGVFGCGGVDDVDHGVDASQGVVESLAGQHIGAGVLRHLDDVVACCGEEGDELAANEAGGADHGDLALRFEGRVGLRGTSRAAFRGESLNCIPLDEMASPGVTARTGASSCPRAGRVGSGRRGGQLAGLAPPDLV